MLDGAHPAQQMWKSFAGLRSEFVYGAVIAIEEHTSGLLSTLQDEFAIRSRLSVLFQKLFAGNSQVFREAHNVFLEDLSFGYAAALGALPAVDRGMNLLRGTPELALHEIVGFDPAPELLILAALLFAQAADLYKVGDH